MRKELVFEYKNVISNAHIDLLEIVLENSLMEFHREYFQQIFGIIMGTNVAPILANLYLVKLEIILKEKSINDPKMFWPIFFKRYIDDGFGITKASRENVEYWIQEFKKRVKSIKIKNKTKRMISNIKIFIIHVQSKQRLISIRQGGCSK